MSMIVRNIRARLIGCGSTGIQFTPGDNVIDDATAKKLEGDKGFAQFVKDGTLVVVKGKGSDDGGKLTVAETVEAIAGMNSVADLTALKAQDSRKGVQKAIDARIAELTAKDDDEDAGDGDNE